MATCSQQRGDEDDSATAVAGAALSPMTVSPGSIDGRCDSARVLATRRTYVNCAITFNNKIPPLYPFVRYHCFLCRHLHLRLVCDLELTWKNILRWSWGG